MSKRLDEVAHDALLLPADSRAILADRLLDSLSRADQKQRDAIWAIEAEARASQIESGEVEALPGESVMKELRDRIKR
jgi:putative addiction module component (TIGR02574 family)